MERDRFPKPAGLLLTGGASTRMGRDKATISIGGETLARRVARALTAIADPVLAIGHEAGTSLPAVDDPRQGPLVAVAAGAAELRRLGHEGNVLVVACDLPFAESALLSLIVSELAMSEADAVVPVAGSRDQPLCACYSFRALERARDLVEQGARSMRELLAAIRVVRLGEERLGDGRALIDIDTPEDIRAAGLTLPD